MKSREAVDERSGINIEKGEPPPVAAHNPGRVDSSRASILRVDPQLFTSEAVRAGAQLVSLLVARYSKSALQQALILCISPSAWVVGWHLREWLQIEFRSILLEKSPRLRVANLAQVEYFAVVATIGIDDAVLAVMHATCPSVVLAVYSQCGVVDGEYATVLSCCREV